MTIKIIAKRLRLHTLRGRGDVPAREPPQVTTLYGNCDWPWAKAHLLMVGDSEV
jgi:hypothetical protein